MNSASSLIKMQEKPLKLEEALRINKGDRVKVSGRWEIRRLAELLQEPLIPNTEYEVKKVESCYVGKEKVILFTVNGTEKAYPYCWFSRYRRKCNNQLA